MENILQNMIFLCYGQSKTEWACGRALQVIFIDFGGATLPVLSKVEFTLWFTIQRSHGKFPNWSPFEVANPPFSMYHPPQSPESPQEMPRFEVKRFKLNQAFSGEKGNNFVYFYIALISIFMIDFMHFAEWCSLNYLFVHKY